MKLSLEEKIRLLSGVGMWRTSDLNGKIKSLYLADGPHGIRKEVDGSSYIASEEATCFPTASCVASSWDEDLVGNMAKGIAREAIEKEISIVLGPGINMKRTPVCGRNFEYFSEDPYLSGMLAVSYINSMEEMGIGTSLKHFAGNNQEANRQTANSQINERTLREIYLRAFEIAIKKSNPATVMCSYNRLNGLYASENKWLLTKVLRDEWDYEGAVISDWGACIDLAKSLEAGLDLEMPDSLGIHGRLLKDKINKGEFDTKHLDRASNNILNLVEKYNPGKAKLDTKEYDNHELARKIASESMILLKNDGVLPINIDNAKSITIIGRLAEDMRFQGGGSSHINPKMHINAIQAFEIAGFNVTYAPGYLIDSEEMNDKLISEAMKACEDSDLVLFFGGLTDLIEGEGFDREDLHMPENQVHLIKELAKAGKEIIYLSFSGAPYKVDFINDVKAFIQVYLAGEAVSEALVDVITGVVNPSGKLAETWPRELADVFAHDYYSSTSKDLQYREGPFIGYRYFDSYDYPACFDFGYGLSYTDFMYSNMSVEIDVERRDYRVYCDIENTGDLDGKEIVQVYVNNPKGFFIRPNRELRGFAKVELKAGESKRICIELDENAFVVYDVRSQSFVDVPGSYEIQLASSLNDVRLSRTIKVEAKPYTKVEKASMSDFFAERVPEISEKTFEIMYGRRSSNFDKVCYRSYSLYNTIDEMAEESLMARIFRFFLIKIVEKRYNKDNDAQGKMMVEGAKSAPFDAVISQSKMPFLRNIGLFLVDLCNKKRFKSIKSLIFGR